MKRVAAPSQRSVELIGASPPALSAELIQLRRLYQEIRIVEERPAETAVPRLWSARAAAEHWCMSRMNIYRAHRAGRLPGYRVLGTLRFLESDLLRLLREEGVPAGEDQ